jgi:hypothetical protein
VAHIRFPQQLILILRRKKMADPKKQPIAGELDNEELEAVQGGMSIPVTGPAVKPSAPGSIAQGDTIDNNDNLPDAGGGVVR